MNTEMLTKEVRLMGFNPEAYSAVLTDAALEFLVALHRKFNAKRLELLEERTIYQAYFDAGNFPNFPKETLAIRKEIGLVLHCPKICWIGA